MKLIFHFLNSKYFFSIYTYLWLLVSATTISFWALTATPLGSVNCPSRTPNSPNLQWYTIFCLLIWDLGGKPPLTVVETEVEPTPLTLEVRGFVPIGTVVDGNEGWWPKMKKKEEENIITWASFWYQSTHDTGCLK